MEKQVEDNVSSTDQMSQGLASSIGENKSSLQNRRDADAFTVSSERVHSAQQPSNRSDVSSETVQPLHEKRKIPDVGRAEESSQEDSTIKPYPHKQLKTDSSSSKESGAVARLSSVDSADPKSYQSLSRGYSHQTQSTHESKSVLQEPVSSMTTTDTVAAAVQSSRCAFDLNEGVEANGADYSQELNESNSSSHAVHASETPIPVVAKVGVPIGLPKKPLQFCGELGWRLTGNTSAFRSTLSKNSDEEKELYGNPGGCISKPFHVDRGFDLNVAAMDSEGPVNDTSVRVCSELPERFPLDADFQRKNKNCSKPGASGFDLNDNPMIDGTSKSSVRQGERREALRSHVPIDTAAFSGGITNQSIPDWGRTPYWVDLSTMRGHVQGQPFLLGAPTAQQVQMVVPVQLPHTAPGLYIGKVDNLTSAFYPPGVLAPLHNQRVSAVVPQISGPVFASYPGNVPMLDSHQGLNPHAYANMSQAFIPNGNIALMENSSRGINSTEILIPPRNSFREERMKAVEQAGFPASSMKRETDAGWDPSQINCRQLASWN